MNLQPQCSISLETYRKRKNPYDEQLDKIQRKKIIEELLKRRANDTNRPFNGKK